MIKLPNWLRRILKIKPKPKAKIEEFQKELNK